MDSLRTQSRVPIGIVAVLLLLLFGSAHVIKQESEVRGWTDALERQQLSLARGEPPPPIRLREPSDTSRALIQAAMLKANLASAADGSDRARLLHDARRYLDRARVLRPRWGEAEIVAAYIASLNGPDQSMQQDRALAQSYQYAPYLRGSAAFRIRLGLERWEQLPVPVRERLIDEAVWYARLDHESRDPMFALIRQTGAYRSFLRRWFEVRSQDLDWAAGREPTAVRP